MARLKHIIKRHQNFTFPRQEKAARTHKREQNINTSYQRNERLLAMGVHLGLLRRAKCIIFSSMAPARVDLLSGDRVKSAGRK